MAGAVLITGASAGLGEGMARLFAARGADLAITARRLDRLEAVRDEIEAAHPGRTVVPFRLDVTDHEAVFETFDQAADKLGHLDRIVVNAGLGKGSKVGAGHFSGNRDTILTNLVGGLAQCEAAMRILYRQAHGQLVVISSVIAARGMGGPMNAYAATKIALAHLAEGIRSDVEAAGLPITVTTLRPGYIHSDMQSRTGRRHPLLTDADTGCRALVEAIERGAVDACVPAWPWTIFAAGLRHAPRRYVRRMV
jgi:NADP-dependent 3-hydroxy acid dehydrogenase YdfG